MLRPVFLKIDDSECQTFLWYNSVSVFSRDYLI